MIGTLLIRADVSGEIGAGHVMRCLALAQEWRNGGGAVAFIQARTTPEFESRLSSENISLVALNVQPGSVEDAKATITHARVLGVKWVVVDGYHFLDEFEEFLKHAGLFVLAMDDFTHATHCHSRLVLNQNMYADCTHYPNVHANKLMMGSRYALIRREVLDRRHAALNVSNRIRCLLITLGGGDQGRWLKKLAAMLVGVKSECEAVVVSGSSRVELPSRVGKVKVDVLQNVTDMGEVLASCDIALSAAGSTCWELCYLGIPAMLIVLAENQRRNAICLHNAGAAINLGDIVSIKPEIIADAFDSLTENRRVVMTRVAQQLVDGAGASRVSRRMQAELVTFRPARDSDCAMVYEWANDPEVRANSFSNAAINWNDHVEWFSRRLKDPNCTFLIAIDNSGNGIGQIRFDSTSAGEATVSVSLDRLWRGRGCGSVILQMATASYFLIQKNIKIIHAYIKPENRASIRAFEQAGYLSTPMMNKSGPLHLIARDLNGDCANERS